MECVFWSICLKERSYQGRELKGFGSLGKRLDVAGESVTQVRALKSRVSPAHSRSLTCPFRPFLPSACCMLAAPVLSSPAQQLTIENVKSQRGVESYRNRGIWELRTLQTNSCIFFICNSLISAPVATCCRHRSHSFPAVLELSPH